MKPPENKDELRASRPELEKALQTAGCDLIRGNAARCPFHEDRRPSASIYCKENVWRFHCHVCKITEDFLGVLDRAGKGFQSESKQKIKTVAVHKTFPNSQAIRDSYFRGVEEVFEYTHPETRKVEMIVVRYLDTSNDKSFCQYRPAANGGFEFGGPPKPWPIFNRTRVKSANEVWVVEGEKCVKALHALGEVATTSPGGAGKAKIADWSPLAGKTCFLWPDNDPINEKGRRPGFDHMHDVASELSKLIPPALVMWIDPSELDMPDKGDVVQFLEPYGNDIEEAVKGLNMVKSIATVSGPAEELSKLLEDVISGKRASLAWPWRLITTQARALMPGMVTCFCGDPACGKSFGLLEAAVYWHRNNVPVALFELEDDRAYHLNRVLAQLEDKSEFTDDVWVKNNPDEVRESFSRHRKFLNSFGACLDVSDDGEVTLDGLLEWVRKQCIAGKRIIAIDPITVADSGDKPWIADRKFILAAKAIVRAYGASLILVTHPKTHTKPGVASPLHGMAGGSAYPRFSHTVLWLYRYDTPKKVQVRGPAGLYTTSINRSIRIGKARNGPGSGGLIGFNFESGSLKFSEQGLIEKELKNLDMDDSADQAISTKDFNDAA